MPKRYEEMKDKKYIINKRIMLRIMVELGLVPSLRKASIAYDAVTKVMNAWLMVWTKELPKGTMTKLRLHNACVIKLCWRKPHNPRFKPYPAVTIKLTNKAKYQLHRLSPPHLRRYPQQSAAACEPESASAAPPGTPDAAAPLESSRSQLPGRRALPAARAPESTQECGPADS